MTNGQLQFTFFPAPTGSPAYPNVVATAPTGTTNPPDVVVFAANTPNPLIHQFDFVFEQQIATNTAVSVSYIGSLGRNLPIFIDRNLFAPTNTITYTFAPGAPNAGDTITVPLFEVPTATPSSATILRPNPLFGRITTISDSVTSKYNALVLQFNRRMTHGLQLQGFYTYSQTTDTGQSSQTFTSANNVLNPFDLSLENGRANFDVRHRGGATLVWRPEYFQHSGRLAKTALDGWTVAPVISISSGAPFTATVSGNAPVPAGFTRVQSGILGAGGSSRLPDIARNGFQMPRIANVDLRIAKKFTIWESTGLELFGEAFNLFNHVNVTSVGTRNYSITGTAAAPTLTFDPQFAIPTGSTTSTGSLTQRQIQIGARFHF